MSKGPWTTTVRKLHPVVGVLHATMIRRRWTQALLAERTGYHVNTISRAFCASTSRFAVIDAMATAMGMEITITERMKK